MSTAAIPAQKNSSNDSTMLTGAIETAMQQARANWGWLVAAGVCSVVVGGLAIAAPLASSLAVETVIAIACAVGGIAWIVSSFKTRTWSGLATRMAIGVVQLAVGFVLLLNPIVGLVSITLLIATFFAADGVLRIVAAVQNRTNIRGWGWIVASGVITVVFAGMIASQLPAAALVLIGVLTGINLLMSGFIQIAFGVAAKRLADDLVEDVVWAANDLNRRKSKVASEAIESAAHRELVC